MEIIYSKHAKKYYEKAPKNLKAKFDAAIENIKISEGDIVELMGQEGTFDTSFTET